VGKMEKSLSDKNMKISLIGTILALIVSVGTIVVNLVGWAGFDSNIRFLLVSVYLLILLLILLYVSSAFDKIRTFRAKRIERKFWLDKSGQILSGRFEATTDSLKPLISGEKSIERVVTKFFERSVTFDVNVPQDFPVLDTILPDFTQVRDILVGHDNMLKNYLRLIKDAGESESEISIAISDLTEHINKFIAWADKIIELMTKWKKGCPTMNIQKAKSEYSAFKDGFSNLVKNWDSLTNSYATIQNSRGKKVYEYNLLKRQFEDFL